VVVVTAKPFQLFETLSQRIYAIDPDIFDTQELNPGHPSILHVQHTALC